MFISAPVLGWVQWGLQEKCRTGPSGLCFWELESREGSDAWGNKTAAQTRIK